MKIDKDLYTSHIKDTEKQLEMKKIVDKIEIVINNYSVVTTDFLDPYERYLAKSILNAFDEIKYIEDGGTSLSERKIITIFPYYLDGDSLDLKLSFLRIKGDLEDLSHKDFLGGLLSIGIKRSKTGDIFIHNDYTDLVVKEEIGSYIFLNLEKIGNRKVTITEIEKKELSEPVNKFREERKFVASLRVDLVLSSIYNLSRQDSINIIKSGNVRVNWEKIIKPSKELCEGDVISVRGYGRAILYSIDGISKKGRFHVNVRILI